MPTINRESRIVGALLGLHAGDSLGATVEFQSHAFIKSAYPRDNPGTLRDITGGGAFKWPAGHATDDTDMTRGVLLAYLDCLTDPQHQRSDVATRAGRYFLKWRAGDWPGRVPPGTRPVDMGAATEDGLRRFSASLDPDNAGAGPGRAGNGSLMRCLPTGLFRAADADRLVAESMRISRITHDDALCTVSCAVYNTMAAELVLGRGPDAAVDAGLRVCRRLEHLQQPDAKKQSVLGALKLGTQLRLQGLAEFGPPPSAMPGGCSGYVLESLSLAVAAVLDPRCLEDVLVDVVRVGKDTDTNAAIAGGLLGARDGEDAIPRRWEEKLQFGDEFRTIATSILRSQNKK
ncbi:ADP-ribosylglycohydrolase family protein [Cordyceps militaris CM01]|uniref:ADP-ribosylhydrolase ARH3 n=1 Tax=Cordyceps militaris (strain CM01) TaxID=983644 RepID=G3JLU9_CORMM|nr:ADP-ribosylglycohydrolase family protein [Cordyceps militaris CM01]EGX90673.1 ADP-ribosylglycohydrolase family protein [Cordyceps militaris CM01]